MAVFARCWLREQVLTARFGHEAQEQDAKAHNRAFPTGLRLGFPLVSAYSLWLVAYHLGRLLLQGPFMLPNSPPPTVPPPQKDNE